MSTPSERPPIAAVVAETVRNLPPAHARLLADALASQDGPGPPADRTRIAELVPTQGFKAAARRLLANWPAGPNSGAAVALALRAAAAAREQARAEQRIEVVWTGPQSPVVPVRTTRSVLLDVIAAAASRLVVVSFAAYRVEEVVATLAAAAARGVDVRLVLETDAAGGGTLRVDAAAAFTSLGASVSFWAWPAHRRPVLPGGRAALHAKAAIADDHTALVTSANLTGYGIHENMELGLLVHGGPVPRRLAAHFDHLMARGELERLA